MSDVEERTVDGYRIRIDRSLCVGFAQCMDVAPNAFRLDPDDVVTFDAPEGVDRGLLREAGDVCPVEALTVFDVDGKQVAP
jgi:ferredoxin